MNNVNNNDKGNRLIINLDSVRKEYHGIERNLRYGQRHFDAYTQDYILKLNIASRLYKGIKSTEVKVEYFNEYYFLDNEITLVFDQAGNYLKSSCNCQFHKSYVPCGHVWLIAKYLHKKALPIPYNYIDENYGDRSKFANQLFEKQRIREAREQSKLFVNRIIEHEIEQQRSIYDEARINLQPVYYKKANYSKYFKIRYKIGEDKKYIVKDLKDKLLSPLKYNQYVEYGKNFKTILTQKIFDEPSQSELLFLKEHADNIDKNTLLINETTIDDFYELHKDDGGIEGMAFIETDFGFWLEVKAVDNYYTLNICDKNEKLTEEQIEAIALEQASETYNVIDGDPFYLDHLIEQIKNGLRNNYSKAHYIFTNKRFYDVEYFKNHANLLYMETSKEEALFYKTIKYNDMYFSKAEVGDIVSIFKDKLSHITISDEIVEMFTDQIIVKPKLYCDINDDLDLILNLKYQHSRATIYLKKLIQKLILVGLTDLNTEYADFDAARNYNIDKVYYITKDTEVIEFIESILPHLNEDADVFLSDSIKNYSYAKTLNLTVGVRVKQNLLNLELKSDDVDPAEFYDILMRYKKKKKYYKMKSGQIIKIDKSQMEDIDIFLKDMGIEDKALKKSNIKVPNYRRFRLSSESALQVETDQKFDKLFEKKDMTISRKYQKILRDYQSTGVKFMLDLRTMKLGGLLADDMGLGKTLQVIAMIESIKIRQKPVLIVTPSSLILNWENEFNKFNSALHVVTVHGAKAHRKSLLSDLQNMAHDKVLITSYDYLKRDLELYKAIDFDTVVIDEAQYIKNYKTKAARSVKALNRDYSIALTGTPIENSLAEIWSVFDFLMPGYLFSYIQFSKNYERPIVLNDDKKVSKRLKTMVEPFILRRLKKDVLTELPDKIEETYYIELNQEERALYDANLYDINMQLKQQVNKNKIEILAMLTRLRQICIDVGVIYDKVYNESSKIKATIELIDKAISNNQKILVFSSFTRILDKIAEKCNENNLDYFMLTGATNKLKRKEYVDRFQAGEADLFLISLKAGGTGLNLTRADLVIHIDPWWNVSAQNQATDRAHRIGQKRTVQVINLIAKDTIEEKIQKMQAKKKELSDTFVENSEGSFAKLSREALIELFS